MVDPVAAGHSCPPIAGRRAGVGVRVLRLPRATLSAVDPHHRAFVGAATGFLESSAHQKERGWTGLTFTLDGPASTCTTGLINTLPRVCQWPGCGPVPLSPTSFAAFWVFFAFVQP